MIGSTDARGEEVTASPLHPSELIGQIYTQLGIPADARLPHPEGRDVRVMPESENRTAARSALATLV